MRGVISSSLGRALRSGSTLHCVAPYGTFSKPLQRDRQALCSKSEQNDALKPKDAVIFQYGECPVGNKVSAFLDYFEIPYIDVKVTPITKKEIKWSANRQLPIFVIDGQPTHDSSGLINKLVKRMQPDYDLDADEDKKWREWVDNYLVHVVLANKYRTLSEALETFEYVTVPDHDEYFSPLYKRHSPLYKRLMRLATLYGGAAAMCYASKKLKKEHNITNECAALFRAVEQWADALNGRKFLGGSNNPNLADLAVYGALRCLIYPDVVLHPQIKRWYFDMVRLAAPCYSEDESRWERLINGDFYDEEFAKEDLS